MITLAFSGFLIGTGLIMLPIILHLLKLKPRTPQAYPALLFLHMTIAKRQNRNRLRKFIILLLRSLILCLIALAFAWPYLAKIDQKPENASVVLWDCSFSVQATPVNAYLNAEALKVLSRASSKYPTVIGAVTESVNWSGDFSADAAKLTQWFNQNNKSYTSSSFREAIRQADNKLKNISAKQKAIIIITDRQLLPWENVDLKQSLTPGTLLKVITPPKHKTINNCAITMAAIQTKYFYKNQPLKLKVNCQNFNTTAVKAKLIIHFNNNKVSEKNVTLPAKSILTETIQLTTPNETPQALSGWIELKVTGDELPIDNIHYFSINPIREPKVFLTPLVGSNRIDFIKTALMPAELANRQIATLLRDLMPATKLEEFKMANLLVLQDIKLFDNNLINKVDNYLNNGGNIVVIWDSSAETQKLLKHFSVKVIKTVNSGVRRFEMLDFEHPILKDYMQVRAGEWFDILFFDVPTIKFPPRTKIIAYFDDQIPAITECSYKNGNLFVIASQLDRKHTNWPTFGSFLPFWRELLLYSERQAQTAYSLTASDGKMSWQEQVEVTAMAPMKPEIKSFLPLNRVGNFTVKSSTQNIIYSINVPGKESATALLPESYAYQTLVSDKKAAPEEKLQAEQKNRLESIQHTKNYWWILLVIAFMLSFVEITLANRTAL